MSRNPGILIESNEGKKYVYLKSQPLIEKKKIVLHLLDDDFKNVIDEETKKPKTILIDLDTWKEEANTKYKAIGCVD